MDAKYEFFVESEWIDVDAIGYPARFNEKGDEGWQLVNVCVADITPRHNKILLLGVFQREIQTEE